MCTPCMHISFDGNINSHGPTLVSSCGNNSCGGWDLVIYTPHIVPPIAIATSNTSTHTQNNEDYNDHPVEGRREERKSSIPAYN